MYILTKHIHGGWEKNFKVEPEHEHRLHDFVVRMIAWLRRYDCFGHELWLSLVPIAKHNRIFYMKIVEFRRQIIKLFNFFSNEISSKLSISEIRCDFSMPFSRNNFMENDT